MLKNKFYQTLCNIFESARKAHSRRLQSFLQNDVSYGVGWCNFIFMLESNYKCTKVYVTQSIFFWSFKDYIRVHKIGSKNKSIVCELCIMIAYIYSILYSFERHYKLILFSEVS